MMDSRANTKIKVLLADDNELFREGLARLLEESGGITVVSKCDNGNEVLSRTKNCQPDLVLTKIDLPGCDGMDTTRWINEHLPRTKVVILTDSEDEQDLFSAIKGGAKGYLLKNTALEDLVRSIELLARGGLIVSARLAERLLDEFSSLHGRTSKAAEDVRLTEREREIVELVARGATNKEIGETLFIAENTVKVHMKNILEKLQLRNKQQVAAYAVDRGLISELVPFAQETTSA
jgi:DNA-binding NarL/FixJ family response regulator